MCPMKRAIRAGLENGFSIMELMISVIILIPIMGAAISLFSLGARQHATEQDSVDMNQDARTGIEMMAREIAQAGSRRDFFTAAPGPIGTGIWTATVNSTDGLITGDWVRVGGTETVQLTNVNYAARTITANFLSAHGNNSSIRLFAFPFETGLVRAAGMPANSSADVNPLRFYGDISGDPNDRNLYYVEYAYDNANNQITRSFTPITAPVVEAPRPFITGIKANSVRFTVNTDAMGVVTSVNLEFTVQSKIKSGTKYQETGLSTRVVIPSTRACSLLRDEIEEYGGDNYLPQTPAQVKLWAGI